MMKILIIVVGRNLNGLDMGNIKKNITDSLGRNYSVDFASVTSDKINNNFKYNFRCGHGQLTKTCHAINNVNIDEYEWFIKTRPDIKMLQKVDETFLNSLSKDKINTRCRGYDGPKINLKHGFSVSNEKLMRKDVKFSEKEMYINPDDQIYFFHKKIAKKAFANLNEDDLKKYFENIKNDNPTWVTNWITKTIILKYESFFENLVPKEENEGYHQFLWNARDIFINPINMHVNLKTKNYYSYKLAN